MNSGVDLVVGVTLSDGVHSPVATSLPVSVSSEENESADADTHGDSGESGIESSDAELPALSGAHVGPRTVTRVTVFLVCAQ